MQLRKSDANIAKGKTIRMARNVKFPYATLPSKSFALTHFCKEQLHCATLILSFSISSWMSRAKPHGSSTINLDVHGVDVQGVAQRTIHNQDI